MYLDFYQMRQQPFGVTPDPAYLYPSPNHREALASLSAGIKEGRGFMALIAPPGMGKTTLLYQLLEDFRDSACTAFLFQTLCDSREFFQYLLGELRIDSRGMDVVAMHARLNEVLFAEMIAGRRFVLVVDEAQNLSDSVLETVRMLSNFETSHTKLLQIVLAGQPQLSEKLSQPHLLQLRQRIAVLSRLEPLSEPETACYIDHRLGVAGYSGTPLFDAEAVRLITRNSGGIPRSINNLCHSALSAACAREQRSVTAELVRQVSEKLDFNWTARSAPEISPMETVPSETAEAAVPTPIAQVPMIDAPIPKLPRLSIAEPSVVPTSAEVLEPVLAVPRFGAGPLSSPTSSARFTKARLAKWNFRATVFMSALVGSGLIFGVVKFMEPSQARAASLARQKAETAQKASDYSADPQEIGAAQIVTVAAMPSQTLKDVAILYVGHFDPQILNEIKLLNPDIKDPDHLQPGQLIRLPLPQGSFRKGMTTSDQP